MFKHIVCIRASITVGYKQTDWWGGERGSGLQAYSQVWHKNQKILCDKQVGHILMVEN